MQEPHLSLAAWRGMHLYTSVGILYSAQIAACVFCLPLVVFILKT